METAMTNTNLSMALKIQILYLFEIIVTETFKEKLCNGYQEIEGLQPFTVCSPMCNTWVYNTYSYQDTEGQLCVSLMRM